MTKQEIEDILTEWSNDIYTSACCQIENTYSTSPSFYREQYKLCKDDHEARCLVIQKILSKIKE